MVDTNIILRSAEPHHPTHEQAVTAVKTLLLEGNRVCLIPQNLIEFWNVATRPTDKNGFGWNVSVTNIEVSRLETLLFVMPDSQSIYREWKKLVLKHLVLGKQVHDTRIVAAMNVHKIKKLLTFNSKDFKRFQNIEIIDPNTF